MNPDSPQVIDIIIPVYNETQVIIPTLRSLAENVSTKFRVLLCYDFEEDSTLDSIKKYGSQGVVISYVKNRGVGAHGAVVSGFNASNAKYVLVFPADDHVNSKIIDLMVRIADGGADVVSASRFMRGGTMIGCPLLKALLVRVAAFTLYKLARLPTHDPTNGFRLFSSRLLQSVAIESTLGFTYSLELIAKCHRLGWKIEETPAQWKERAAGKSRFDVIGWIPAYLVWYIYIFETTFIRRGPESVLKR